MGGIAQQALLMATNLPAVVRTVSGVSSFSGSSPYTISGIGIGAAAAGKFVTVGVSFATALASPALTSATIGGVAATIIAQSSVLISGVAHITAGYALIGAVIPTATTVNVSLAFNVSVQGEILTGTLLNLLSTTPIDLVNSQPAFGSGTFSGNIGTNFGGALLVGATPASDATSYSPSGFVDEGQGVLFSSGGSNYDYYNGSQIATNTDPAAPFSLTRVGGAGSSWSGPIIAASFR